MLKSVLAFLTITTLLLACRTQAPTAFQPLFMIKEKGKTGYMDSLGKIIIPPVFNAGDEFSDGLAAVRQNGLYGFIDTRGTFVIKPQYDLANSFVNGIAGVYKNEQLRFINKQNRQVLDGAYVGLGFLNEQRRPNEQIFWVKTRGGKQGIIDLATKKLLADTIYQYIETFIDGVAIAHEYVSDREKKEPGVALIDTAGNTIIPFGRYKQIRSFSEGYAIVEIENPSSEEHIYGAIDTKGTLLFKKTFSRGVAPSGYFRNGLARMYLYKYWRPEKKGVITTSEKSYPGFINLKGEIVLNDTTTRDITDFSCGRAFSKNADYTYNVINTSFKPVSKATFGISQTRHYQNNYALVQDEEGWGIIDTNANYVVPAQYKNIDDETGIIGNYFFFYAEDTEYVRHYGIANLANQQIYPMVIQQYDKRGFVNGLLKTLIDERLTYINEKGAIVWQESKDSLHMLTRLNIDYMVRGYFYVRSTPEKDEENPNNKDWSPYNNIPQKNKSNNGFKDGILSVTIDTHKKDTFDSKYNGHALYVINNTKDTINFNTEDGRLNMQLQAQNNKGEWQDIEYLPHSWCGNSYYNQALEPGAYWQFTIPEYEGAIKTRIRAELKYTDPADPKKKKICYSNNIEGRVNPGQFWNQHTNQSHGIMDPYND